MTYTITPEEKARREQIAQAKQKIKDLAAKRRLILSIYRTPHGTPEFLKALAEARKTLGIDEKYVGPWNAYCTPGRFDWRGDTHIAHLELAQLTGKPHVRETATAGSNP